MANDRTVTITISASLTASNLSDFPYLFERNAFPDEAVDPSGSNAARTDGGDLRFYQSSVEFPRDVVAFEHDSSISAGDAAIEVWGKVPDIDAASGASIELQYGDGTLTDHAASDPNGRNAVWSDYVAVYHLDGASTTDSTGNGHTISWTGSPGTETGPFGSSVVSLDGSTQYGTVTDADAFSLLESADTATISLWVNFDSTPGAFTDVALSKIGEWALHANDVGGSTSDIGWRVSTIGGNTSGDFTDTFNVNSWAKCVAYWTAGTQITSKVDNNSAENSSTTDTSSNTTGDLLIGNYTGGDDLLDGGLAEIWITTIKRSEAWLSAEYANQNSPASYVSVGTPSAVSGGVTATLGAAAANASAVAPNVVLGSVTPSLGAAEATASAIAPTVLTPVNVTPVAASATAQAVAPTVKLGSVAPALSPATANASAVAPSVVQGSIAPTLVAAAATAYAVAPTVKYGSVTVTLGAATANASAIAPTVANNGVTVRPTAATANAGATPPTVVLGSVTPGLTPAEATASARIKSLDPPPERIDRTRLIVDPGRMLKH